MPATPPEMKFGVVGDAMVVGSSAMVAQQDIELRAIEEGTGCKACEGSHRADPPQAEGQHKAEDVKDNGAANGAANGVAPAGPPPPAEDDAPGALGAEPIEDDGEETGEFADEGEDESGMPKKVKKAKDVLATGHSDVVKKYHKGDPALGVPAFPQAPVCDAALERAEVSFKEVNGYDEGIHGICKWIQGCCVCLPACLGIVLLMNPESQMGGIVEFFRCICWMPSLVAHADAEAVIAGSKATLKPFQGLGDIEKIDLVQAWLGTKYSSAFLGLTFATELPDGLIGQAQMMNTLGMLAQVGAPITYIVVFFWLEQDPDYGMAVMVGALVVGLVNMCISFVLFGGLGKVGNTVKASRKKIEAGCSCKLECQEYYDAGGLKGFAEAKKNVKGEVKKIREATKVVEKYTAK